MRYLMKLAVPAICLLLALTACQQTPTKVRETVDRRFEGAGAIGAPIQITPETAVVDARSAFDYSVAHIPHSLNLQWNSFTQLEPESRGLLMTDLNAVVRRLAVAGLSPSTPVVVAGRGLGGDGEEGRIAWMLAYLGFSKVQFAAIDSLKPRYTNLSESPSTKAITPWKLESVESLNVERAELLQALPQGGKGANGQYRIVDVRSVDDYLGRTGIGGQNAIPNMGATNIPWTEFFDAALRPRPEMLKRLSGVGIRPEHRVIVIDTGGISSGAVTLALRSLGYSRAGNYSGGLVEFLSHYRD
jgi:thiosulfate/3-mercaptopyruvate sulfurtransferase